MHQARQGEQGLVGGDVRRRLLAPDVLLAGLQSEDIAALARGVNPGYPLGRDYAGLDDALLVAVTEKRTIEEIDRLAEALAP